MRLKFQKKSLELRSTMILSLNSLKSILKIATPAQKHKKTDLQLEGAEKNLGVKKEQEELEQEHLEVLSGVVEELYFLLQLNRQDRKN